MASTMSDGEGDEHNVSRNPLLTRERQMQLLLLSPEMLARREDVLNFLAALMPRCVIGC